MNEPRINIPEWTVTELSAALRRTVEDTYGHVRVRGEISGYRGPHSSGHAYFALKDESARIAAVIWRPAFVRMRIKPEDGLEVIATGRLTTYPGRSTYQIVIESLEPAGLGALMALLEQRKQKLAAEGLFEEARKQLLPYLPDVIGVVTSPTGAVIRDILHRLAERFPRHVLVWPVRVQGDGAAEESAAAIRGFNAIGDDDGSGLALGLPRPDLIIAARGGGSIEDLWAFNEEIVVRAAAESLIPLISAVGHETDITLIDFVADRRAPRADADRGRGNGGAGPHRAHRARRQPRSPLAHLLGPRARSPPYRIARRRPRPAFGGRASRGAAPAPRCRRRTAAACAHRQRPGAPRRLFACRGAPQSAHPAHADPA